MANRRIMSDFVYKKAPLIEVIVEIHWALKPLGSAPNAAIDPYYDLFREAFLENCKAELPIVEQLVPAEIPAEFVSDQPHLRLRPEKAGWPLVQIGPGVMTINIVPPYAGWAEFKRFIERAFDLLYRSYPMAKKTLQPLRAHLRYIDVFDAKYGLDGFSNFVDTHLGAAKPIRPEVVEELAENPKEITYTTDSRFAVKSPVGSTARVRIVPGQSGGRDAVVLELHCDGPMSGGYQLKETLLSWYDEAHTTLHVLFDKTTSAELKAQFGNRVEIPE